MDLNPGFVGQRRAGKERSRINKNGDAEAMLNIGLWTIMCMFVFLKSCLNSSSQSVNLCILKAF